MHPKLSLLSITCLVIASFSSPVQAGAGQITGTWQCQQRLQPDPQISVELNYEHQFAPNRQFNLEGQLAADFGGNQLQYRFRGDGSWEVQGQQLVIETRNSEFRPNNTTAQQFHDFGILRADQFDNSQSSDRFDILQLNSRELHLRHTQEDFSTRCQRR